ncbi:MAG TPA: SDR family NAD(P)-dependent oxidoreductase [Gammaproteobacteria bacterium]|jgi:NAD(P)-dependent dehydrogenase (short-subunit alcohol dehydrogenase family)|nr:SDR family NAD(P)-dependent oxidoreductase [Gammaproteobacteria bacterium]MDP7153818.1 SDR family NAD(P)-dependent oxidoreductase [Gammaproteobacteria bacterium]MDP7296870.1 SDR family NAD(P)-dependent oxidoreductase [Gammaproteobacteria bacterium]HJP38351.1 SDR family NAD(P)-dependent oxidoreductase [Gammaproteobacteria bacterium]
MGKKISRRTVIQSSSALGLTAMWPFGVRAEISGLPRSEYGFATTAEEVVAGIDLSGKTVLVTGCNSGLGYESMRVMAARGAHVIGTARTTVKAEKACASVTGQTTPLVCELTDFDNIVACSEQVQALNLPIDIFMCNAGIMALPKLEQVNGIEKQFLVNHLGHYLLTRRLLPQVEAASAGRIVVLSSIGYRNAPKVGIQFDNLSGADDYSPFRSYGQSKLANALFSRELARRYADTRVTSNTLHPGYVATNLGRHVTGKLHDPSEPLRKGFKTADQGAATQVYLATDARLTGVSGHYFEDCNPVEPDGPHMHDDALALKLWQVSEELTAAYL